MNARKSQPSKQVYKTLSSPVHAPNNPWEKIAKKALGKVSKSTMASNKHSGKNSLNGTQRIQRPKEGGKNQMELRVSNYTPTKSPVSE